MNAKLGPDFLLKDPQDSEPSSVDQPSNDFKPLGSAPREQNGDGALGPGEDSGPGAPVSRGTGARIKFRARFTSEPGHWGRDRISGPGSPVSQGTGAVIGFRARCTSEPGHWGRDGIQGQVHQ